MVTSELAPPIEATEAVDDWGSNSTLSVIIRFHQGGNTQFLDEALFSLALQDWDELELLLMVQNATSELEAEVEELAHRQPWRVPPRVRVLSVTMPAGADGRSRLLNRGIATARGRYLAYLDYDDLVYPHGYRTLISRLRSHGYTWAVGGCLKARSLSAPGHWYVVEKTRLSKGRSAIKNLCAGNSIAIHSYVIDRARLGDFDIGFDEELTRGEDYDFLLRLATRHRPDLGVIEDVVCEYRMRMDGSNTVLDCQATASHEAQREWSHCLAIVDRRRHLLRWSVTIAELAALDSACDALDAQLQQHRAVIAELSATTTQHSDLIIAQQAHIEKLEATIAHEQAVVARQAATIEGYERVRLTSSYQAFEQVCGMLNYVPRPVRRAVYYLLQVSLRVFKAPLR